MQIVTIRIGAIDIPVRVFKIGESAPEDAETLAVGHDRDEIEKVLIERLITLNWRLRPEFMGQPVRERYLFAAERRFGQVQPPPMTLYNFLGENLPKERVVELYDALRTFHRSLNDRRFFKLTSIQVLPRAPENDKSGGLMWGAERVAEQRFELYPGAFQPGAYDDRMGCTRLQGTCWHEATHVCLGAVMDKLWRTQAVKLGWHCPSDGTKILLPGGARQIWVQLFPERCPTEYATFQMDDDCADSVVAELAPAISVDPLRRQLVQRLLMRDPYTHQGSQREQIQKLSPELPALKVPVFKLTNPVDSGFRIKGTSRIDLTERVLTPDQFRAEYFAHSR